MHAPQIIKKLRNSFFGLKILIFGPGSGMGKFGSVINISRNTDLQIKQDLHGNGLIECRRCFLVDYFSAEKY
jgi:hypothetical protein